MPTALITGASSGIGRELASRFARDRHDLILASRRADELARLAGKLSSEHGIAATPLAVNLADPAAPAAIMAELQQRNLTVDVLVNSAGVGSYGLFAQTPMGHDQTMLRLNVEALVALTKLVLPGMVRRGQGRVANLSSTAAFQPGPRMAVYYATKAFVQSFSEALAHELRGTGVTVTAICPGAVLTGFQRAAGLEGRRIPTVVVVPVERVADVAYRGIMRGDRVVIPGLGNRMLALAAKLAPRRAVTAVVGWVNS